MSVHLIRTLTITVLLACSVSAFGQESHADTAPNLAPDIREDETRLKIQDGNFVAVPIPMANPTLDAGLIAGAAYFYPQTEEQKKQQPASVTGLAGMYTTNESWALGGFHQSYWREDTWRFTGMLGAADLLARLFDVSPDAADPEPADETPAAHRCCSIRQRRRPGPQGNPGLLVVRPLGLEPRTCGLRVRCSAN